MTMYGIVFDLSLTLCVNQRDYFHFINKLIKAQRHKVISRVNKFQNICSEVKTFSVSFFENHIDQVCLILSLFFKAALNCILTT